MRLLDTSGLILFLDFIPEYEFLISFSEIGEVMIITPIVEKEYFAKSNSSFNDSDYHLNNLIYTKIILKETCKVNEIFKNRYFTLGNGEKSIMSLALDYKDQNKYCVCVLDDKDARKIAKKLELNVIGSIGLLKILKDKGLLKNSKEIISKIKSSPFRVSDNILEELNA